MSSQPSGAVCAGHHVRLEEAPEEVAELLGAAERDLDIQRSAEPRTTLACDGRALATGGGSCGGSALNMGVSRDSP